MILVDKHGQLGIWDARAQPDDITDEDGQEVPGDPEGGKYWRLQVHWPATSKSSISCVKFDPVNSKKVRFYQPVLPRIFFDDFQRCIQAHMIVLFDPSSSRRGFLTKSTPPTRP